jgi:hypothetical protein
MENSLSNLKLDNWQKEVDQHDGNIVLRSGRQVGKSFIISKKGGDYAAKNFKKTVLIIASVERQSYLMLEKTLAYLEANFPKKICRGNKRPTKSKIQLTNGSIIHSLPTGLTGYGIRGFTIDMLIADEAAFIPEEVWTAVTPMLATTDSKIILLSTPHGKGGYYYSCFKDDNFRAWHISSEACPRIDKDFLAREKARMTDLQYAQEYLGEFIDELRQVFTDSIIKECMKLKRQQLIRPKRKYYLGVDIARMGDDESTFEIMDMTNRKKIIHVENLVTKKTLTTDTTKMIIMLEDKYHFKQIFVDDGGMGVGVLDQLLDTPSTRRKTIAINNTHRPLTRDEKKKKKVIKEDIINNLLMLMERGEISLLDDPEIFLSLKSVQFEITAEGKTKYFGNYMHIADGLFRAAWCCKDKSLNIYKY